jgi:hypothetical protein
MDLFLIPVQLMIIGIFVFRSTIIGWFPKSIKDIYTLIADDMKLEVRSSWKTVFIPIILIVLAYFAWILFCNYFFNTFPIVPITDIPFAVDSILLAPFSEQIAQGFFLTLFFLFFSRVIKINWVVCIFCFVGLILTSYLLTSVHDNPQILNFYLRFFLFMIYGTLYLLNERNLLPAIVAHTTWNVISMNQISF